MEPNTSVTAGCADRKTHRPTIPAVDQAGTRELGLTVLVTMQMAADFVIE
jgi:hypothetical protein